MVYGIIKLINFAHGDIYMIGAYVGFFATSMFKMSFIPALLSAMVIAAIVGMIIERLAYRPLRKAPKIAVLITAIGISLLLEYGMMLLFTPHIDSLTSQQQLANWEAKFALPEVIALITSQLDSLVSQEI